MIHLYRTDYSQFITEIFSEAIRKASQGKRVFINQLLKRGIITDWKMCEDRLQWTRGDILTVPKEQDLVILENPIQEIFTTISEDVDVVLINPQWDFQDFDAHTYMKVVR